MSELPDRWQTSTVGECFLEIKNGTTATQNKLASGVPVSRIETIQKNKFDLNRIQHIESPSDELVEAYKYQEGDIAFSHINSFEHVGKTALYEGKPENLIHGMNLLRLRRGHEYIYPKFAHYFMLSNFFRDEVRKRVGHAVNQVSINQRNLSEVPFVLAPRNEQRRIVAKLEKLLSRVDAARARLTSIPRILKRFRQSVLAAACAGHLTVDWREENETSRNGSPVILNGDTSELPSEWGHTPLSSLVAKLDQGWSPKCEIEPSPSPKVWGVIKTTAVQAIDFLEGENKRLPIGLPPRPRLELKVGDLLMTRAGPRVRAGVCCLVRAVRPRLMICDKVYRFRVNEKMAIPEFLVLALNTPTIVEHIDTLKTGTSESGLNLTQEKFLRLEVPLPPFAEQQEIVRRVEALFKTADALEARYRKAKAHVDKLTQSILAKAFRGELVPQDPNDEPASVLLERIREQRNGAPTKKPARTNRRGGK